MDADDITAFDDCRQTELETLYPALIQFAGEPLNCACAPLRDLDAKAVPGGIIGEFKVVFRIRKTLFESAPQAGSFFQWKRAGEADWRGTVALVGITDPSLSVAYLLYGNNPNE